MLGYSALDPKTCRQASVGRMMDRETVNQRTSSLYDNLEATGWRAFAMRERANQQSGQNAVAVTVKEL